MSQVASSDGPTALPTQQNTNEASLRPAAGTTLAKMCRDLSEQERQNVTNGEPENAVLERYKRVSRLIEPGIFCAPQARRFLRHTDRRTRTSRFRHARQRQPASHPHSLTHSTLAHINYRSRVEVLGSYQFAGCIESRARAQRVEGIFDRSSRRKKGGGSERGTLRTAPLRTPFSRAQAGIAVADVCYGRP